MNHRLNSLIAVFFVVQIVLPFTAPLHVCDFNDLFGNAASHQEPGSQKSSPLTQTPAKEAEAEGDTFVSPLAASTLSASVALFSAPVEATGIAWSFTISSTSSTHVRQTILRL